MLTDNTESFLSWFSHELEQNGFGQLKVFLCMHSCWCWTGGSWDERHRKWELTLVSRARMFSLSKYQKHLEPKCTQYLWLPAFLSVTKGCWRVWSENKKQTWGTFGTRGTKPGGGWRYTKLRATIRQRGLTEWGSLKNRYYFRSWRMSPSELPTHLIFLLWRVGTQVSSSRTSSWDKETGSAWICEVSVVLP